MTRDQFVEWVISQFPNFTNPLRSERGVRQLIYGDICISILRIRADVHSVIIKKSGHILQVPEIVKARIIAAWQAYQQTVQQQKRIQAAKEFDAIISSLNLT